MGREHQVEVARFGKVVSAALGAFDFMGADEIGHLGDAHPIGALLQGLFDQVVAAESAFASFAVDESVVKPLEMARSGPSLRVQQDGAIEAYHIAPLLDKGLPPEVFHIFFELGAIGAERVSIGKTAIDF